MSMAVNIMKQSQITIISQSKQKVSEQ